MSILEFEKLSLLLLSKIKIQFLIVGIVVSNPTVIQAQIIPDRTLPNNSTVTNNNNNNTVEINGGTVRETNLFHSFSEFSINPDGLNNAINTAHFNNADNITAIFSRITGNSISEINGLIKANGSADLFLINPNGIIFGENASLDIGGSFISSTADSIQFAGEKEFSAVNPQTNPLLTVNIPVGLQYGEQSQAISVLGSALEVIENETLGLIGGNVFVEEGSLTTTKGNIELGSVQSDRTVELNSHTTGWELDYAAVDNFGEISLSDAASIEVTGDGGTVQLQGDSVSLAKNSAISLYTDDIEDAGNLNINAQEIELEGVDSGLFSVVLEDAAGNGANINLQTDRLTIKDGAQIAVDTLGLGNGGNLTIDAQEINLINHGGIFAQAITDIGNGGDIAIATDTLSIQNGAKIYGGNFSQNIESSDSNVLKTLQTSSSSLSYTIIGTGEVGNIDINAGSVILNSNNGNSSSISSSAYAQGGGIIQVNSDTISISNNSQIYTETKGNSHGGGIYVSADNLSLHSGGKINTDTFAVGNAGKIIIEIGDELIADGNNSGIFSQGNINASGNAGNIGIVGDVVSFSNGSRIDAANFGLGKDGTISIEAQQLNTAEETVIQNVDNKNDLFGNISVAGLRIDSNQPLNMIEPYKTINNPTELTVSSCIPEQNRNIAINEVFNSISTVENLTFWRSPTKKVASQNLDRIYQQETTVNNSITEAESWIINSEGKVELLANSCS